MNTLTKSLLTGAATCALTAVPALAHGFPHAMGIRTANAVQFQGVVHQKTDVHTPSVKHVTATYNFTDALHRSTAYNKFKLLGATTWLTSNGSGKCATIPGQKFKMTSLANAARKVKMGTSKAFASINSGTMHCTGNLTYYGADYKLLSHTLSSDSLTGKDFVNNYLGYDLKIIQNYTITIS